MHTTFPVYMDYHATTPVDPRVVQAMFPFFSEQFGNPGSSHSFGDTAWAAVDAARDEIAAAIGGKPKEIIFTSGATESNSLAIRGVAERTRRRGDHFISVTTEHSAVLDPLDRLAKRGYDVTLLQVEQHDVPRAGWLDPQRVADAIREKTCLVSVMLANNEIGVVHPLAEIGAICKDRGLLLHCDATQAIGRLPVNVDELGVDLMSFTAHKIYGPKGVGALYVRSRDPIVRLEAQITGGGQQEGRRSGTLNVSGIVGLAVAVRLCVEELETEIPRLTALRNRLAEEVLSRVDGTSIVGPALAEADTSGRPLRLPGNLVLAFAGLEGQSLMLQMPDLAVSSGATCSAADPKPSHVLSALGMSDVSAKGCLRFGLGRPSTNSDVDFAVLSLKTGVERLQELC